MSNKNRILKSIFNSLLVTCILIILLLGCDNRKQIEDSKKESLLETENFDKLKYDYEKSIDSLHKEIDSISKQKSKLANDNKYAEAQIYSILKESNLDHVIIGTEDSFSRKKFFSDTLGFTIREGKLHDNGIENFFIEFEDNSEIEMIKVDNPKDNISKFYKSLIEERNYGMQFALRTIKLNELMSHFGMLNSDYNKFNENIDYSVLSKIAFDSSLPLFFIQYKIQNFNTKTEHQNSAFGIRSIWFSTKKIKDTIFELVDLGFQLVDTTRIYGFSNKAVLMKNDNFEIILIEENDYGIAGVTIKSEDLSKIRRILDNNDIEYIVYKNDNGENVILKPETTKSIWIEFNEP